MKDASHAADHKTYWFTWLALLGLTLVMILIGRAGLPAKVMLPLVLTGMLAKSGLIGAYFMHLRFERLILVAAVVISIIFTCASLYFLIAIDGRWVNEVTPR
jgi:cytochrome c oxidase subunit IV